MSLALLIFVTLVIEGTVLFMIGYAMGHRRGRKVGMIGAIHTVARNAPLGIVRKDPRRLP